MLSFDTNILFPGVVRTHFKHAKAIKFIASLQANAGVIISEFILLELYVLLRNPTVMPSPLGAEAAVEVCQTFRRHPKWQVAGFPENSSAFHDSFWSGLAKESSARRRAYDCRTARTLRHFGVTEFATENLKDFEGFGFSRVWNPLA